MCVCSEYIRISAFKICIFPSLSYSVLCYHVAAFFFLSVCVCHFSHLHPYTYSFIMAFICVNDSIKWSTVAFALCRRHSVLTVLSYVTTNGFRIIFTNPQLHILWLLIEMNLFVQLLSSLSSRTIKTVFKLGEFLLLKMHTFYAFNLRLGFSVCVNISFRVERKLLNF